MEQTQLLTSILEIPGLSSQTKNLSGLSPVQNKTQPSFLAVLKGPHVDIADPFALAQKKKNAQAAVLGAIQVGILVRPGQCSECPRSGKIEAHHDNYDEPLIVRWLCACCHRKADTIRRQNEGRVRPVCWDFAEFLLVNGEVTLPLTSDPPVEECDTWVVYRAVRSFRFAGLDAKERPLVALVLSCGHAEIATPGVLLSQPTARICSPCSDSEWRKRWERAERRRARRAAR